MPIWSSQENFLEIRAPFLRGLRKRSNTSWCQVTLALVSLKAELDRRSLAASPSWPVSQHLPRTPLHEGWASVLVLMTSVHTSKSVFMERNGLLLLKWFVAFIICFFILLLRP